MKANKILLIALISTALAVTSAVARPSGVRTASNWSHRHYGGHHYHHGSNVFFNLGFGFPFYYGYPYYGYSPYGYYPYGYYSGPREVIYQAATVDRSTAVAVQRHLAQGGYYRGAIDGVLGGGTRSAIRSYERAHGLHVDGLIDQRLLATMGLA